MRAKFSNSMTHYRPAAYELKQSLTNDVISQEFSAHLMGFLPKKKLRVSESSNS